MAYFFFWSLIISKDKKYMMTAMGMIALYFVLCVVGIMSTLIFIYQPVLYAVKARTRPQSLNAVGARSLST